MQLHVDIRRPHLPWSSESCPSLQRQPGHPPGQMTLCSPLSGYCSTTGFLSVSHVPDMKLGDRTARWQLDTEELWSGRRRQVGKSSGSVAHLAPGSPQGTVSRWCAESLLGILESNRSWPSGTQEEQQVKAWRVTGQPGSQGQHHRRWLIEHTFIPPSSGGWSSKVIRVLTSKQCPRHVDGHLLTRQRGGALRGFFL